MDLYVNTSTGSVISDQGMRAANPNTIFPIPFEPVDGYAALEETTPPYDPATQKLIYSSTATEVNGKWTRTISVVPLTQEELDAIKQSKVPHAVTMRQARLALLEAGLLGTVSTVIASLPSPQKEAAEIEWEYAQEVERHAGLVSVLGPALGLTPAQLDDLFISAGAK